MQPLEIKTASLEHYTDRKTYFKRVTIQLNHQNSFMMLQYKNKRSSKHNNIVNDALLPID